MKGKTHVTKKTQSDVPRAKDDIVREGVDDHHDQDERKGGKPKCRMDSCQESIQNKSEDDVVHTTNDRPYPKRTGVARKVEFSVKRGFEF
jgi:hypothetical protein